MYSDTENELDHTLQVNVGNGLDSSSLFGQEMLVRNDRETQYGWQVGLHIEHKHQVVSKSLD